MMNNVILVGTVVTEPKLITLDSGYKVANIVLSVQRPFRNENNVYETDFIPIQVWMALAEIVCDYVGKGSIVGLKCRLSTRIVEVGEIKLRSIEVTGERVSFISLKPRTDKNVKTNETEYQDQMSNTIVNDPDINTEDVIDLSIKQEANTKKKTKKEE